VRIEHDYLDGAGEPIDGELRPDLRLPGLGLRLKEQDLRVRAVQQRR
jgi:hypothetical protein